MVQIFDELAYSHYKEKNWQSMFRQKLRLRFDDYELPNEIIELFNSNKDLAKKFYRIDRKHLIKELNKFEYSLPNLLKNMIYFMNYRYVKDPEFTELTPDIVLNWFKEIV